MAPKRKRQWLRITDTLWPDARHPKWYVRATWAEVAGRPECIGIEIWKGAGPDSDDPGTFYAFRDHLEPIRATDLRGLPVATILDKLRRRGVELDRQGRSIADQVRSDRADDPDVLAALTPMLEALEAGTGFVEASRVAGPGRPPVYGLDHFGEVARVYLEAWHTGQPPREAVRKHFDVTPTTAAKWISRARNELHLLDETTPGRAGGASVVAKTAQRRKGR